MDKPSTDNLKITFVKNYRRICKTTKLYKKGIETDKSELTKTLLAEFKVTGSSEASPQYFGNDLDSKTEYWFKIYSNSPNKYRVEIEMNKEDKTKLYSLDIVRFLRGQNFKQEDLTA